MKERIERLYEAQQRFDSAARERVRTREQLGLLERKHRELEAAVENVRGRTRIEVSVIYDELLRFRPPESPGAEGAPEGTCGEKYALLDALRARETLLAAAHETITRANAAYGDVKESYERRDRLLRAMGANVRKGAVAAGYILAGALGYALLQHQDSRQHAKQARNAEQTKAPAAEADGMKLRPAQPDAGNAEIERQVASYVRTRKFALGDPIIIIDKKKEEARVYTVSLSEERRYPVSTSKNRGPKRALGDGRTPECPDGEPFYITEVQDSSGWIDRFGGGKGAFGGHFLRFDTAHHALARNGKSEFGIHGTNQPWLLGTPASHGCVRFANEAIEELVDSLYARVNTPIIIKEGILEGHMRQLSAALPDLTQDCDNQHQARYQARYAAR